MTKLSLNLLIYFFKLHLLTSGAEILGADSTVFTIEGQHLNVVEVLGEGRSSNVFLVEMANGEQHVAKVFKVFSM